MFDAGLAEAGKILVLQPRRVAVRATAARMSFERGTRLGDEIGYQVRFESKTSSRTRIEVITEGILLRLLHQSPFLEGIAAIIFDEFHERSLASDLALGMVRQIQQSVRPELRIVVMSATLAAEPIRAISAIARRSKARGECSPSKSATRRNSKNDRCRKLSRRERPICLRNAAATCWCFCRESAKFAKLHDCSNHSREQNVELLQLYGDLPADEQDRVLLPSNRRKLILSTNVAETSLTIEGVDGVVDSGVARILRYDERTGLDRLEISPISKASADQRSGRAGRTRNGICLRLWPKAAEQIRPEFEEPEIHRVDLAGAALQVLSWIEPDLATFPWFEAPNPRALERACDLLERLGACESWADHGARQRNFRLACASAAGTIAARRPRPELLAGSRSCRGAALGPRSVPTGSVLSWNGSSPDACEPQRSARSRPRAR